MASGRSTTPRSGKRPTGKSAAGGSRNGSRGRSPVAGARRRTPGAGGRQVPWGILGAVAVIVVLVAVIGYFLFDTNNTVGAFRPSDSNRDPSLQIPGIKTVAYQSQVHITPTQRVAYDQSPPFGGPHDGYWAACNGVVYATAVRNENMVHSLEHGAVWIAYDPARITGAALDTLKAKVDGQDYTMMSPYPGLDQPISLQSWGHQLKLSDPNDPRIDQFVTSLRQNQYTYPEIGARCDALGPGYFDPNDPPPFDPLPAPAGSVPMNYQGTPGAAGASAGSGG